MIQSRDRIQKAPRRQRGITLWGLLYVLVTLGVIALVAITSVPVYLNAYDIRTTLAAVAGDPSMADANASDIQRAVQRRFDAGYVDNIHGRDVQVERAANARVISVAYDVRRQLLFNVSLVYSFDQSATIGGGDGR